MRQILIPAAMTLMLVASPTLAQTASAPPAAKPAPAPAKAKLTTTDTELGVLLDNPATKAIIEKHIPGMTSNNQIDMARSMTLKAIQQYSPDDVTDARLAAIDEDFAKLP